MNKDSLDNFNSFPSFLVACSFCSFLGLHELSGPSFHSTIPALDPSFSAEVKKLSPKTNRIY